jgi:CheY-like chemotaxis protein
MKKTIYLVDDDEDDRLFISDAIQQVIDQVHIIEFDNGFDFLKLFDGTYSNMGQVLVLMDINMPRMSGLEVISTLKSKADYKHLPILAISTATDSRLIDQIIETGASGYFAKPGSLMEIQQLALDIKDFYGKHYL